MHPLEHALRDYDPVMLSVIAARWDVDLESHSVTDIRGVLLNAMRDPAACEATWDRLDDEQRGAMQILLGSGGTMPAAKFYRLYGEIREMGPGRLEREKPYLDPVSVAEALYYRGLIAKSYEEAKAGPQAVIYVPSDLARALPTHHTGFDLSAEDDDVLPLDDDEEEDEPLPEGWTAAADQPDEIWAADTTIVDDLTTVLAYLQVAAVEDRADGTLPQAHRETLEHFLLKPEADRLAFLLGLARALSLVAPRDGLLRPVSHNARRWLEAARSEQVRLLAAGWRESMTYNELFHAPELVVETAGNDPRLAREMVATYLADLPPDSWWIVSGVVGEIREIDADFQRPGGDYESWYIRGADGGDYLHGFESWDAVEGAQLRFLLTGPLHWLGLADLGRYAGGLLGRLNAYGRAFVSGTGWPARPDEAEVLVLQDNGTAEVSRRFSRYDRFQLARFTEWLGAAERYRYRFSPRGLRRASAQGIKEPQVRSFLTRVSGSETLPEGVDAMLTRWSQAAEADATIERLTVLRTRSAQAMEVALNEPAIRRYLGARLGPEAVIVRPGQGPALQDALAEHGMLADILDAASGDAPA